MPSRFCFRLAYSLICWSNTLSKLCTSPTSSVTWPAPRSDAALTASCSRRRNASALGLPGVDVRAATAASVLAAGAAAAGFPDGADVVLVDPPYDLAEDALAALLAALALAAVVLLAARAVAVAVLGRLHDQHARDLRPVKTTCRERTVPVADPRGRRLTVLPRAPGLARRSPQAPRASRSASLQRRS